MAAYSGETCIYHGCSACCRDVLIRLTPIEAKFLRGNGTDLTVPVRVNGRKNKPREDGKAFFEMHGQCGLFSPDDLCTAYNDPRRPKACEAMAPCSSDCDDLREDQGLQPITLYDVSIADF